MSTTTANSSESIGYRELIRGNRNFRLLWLGQIISLLGDWFNFVASAFAHRNTDPVRIRYRQPLRCPHARTVLRQPHRWRGRRPL